MILKVLEYLREGQRLAMTLRGICGRTVYTGLPRKEPRGKSEFYLRVHFYQFPRIGSLLILLRISPNRWGSFLYLNFVCEFIQIIIWCDDSELTKPFSSVMFVICYLPYLYYTLTFLVYGQTLHVFCSEKIVLKVDSCNPEQNTMDSLSINI